MSTTKFSVRTAHKILRIFAHRKGKTIRLSSYDHHGCKVLTVVYSFDHGEGDKMYMATFTPFSIKSCRLLGEHRVEDPLLTEVFQEIMGVG